MTKEAVPTEALGVNVPGQRNCEPESLGLSCSKELNHPGVRANIHSQFLSGISASSVELPTATLQTCVCHSLSQILFQINIDLWILFSYRVQGL